MSLTSILKKVEQKLDQKLQPAAGQLQGPNDNSNSQTYQGYPQTQNYGQHKAQNYGQPPSQNQYHPDHQAQAYSQPQQGCHQPQNQQYYQPPPPPPPHHQYHTQQSHAQTSGHYNSFAAAAPPQLGLTQSSRKVSLHLSGSASYIFAREPGTKNDIYTLKDSSSSTLPQKFLEGGREGVLVGGYKTSSTTDKVELHVGDPDKPGHQVQKLRGGGDLSFSVKTAFKGPDGKEYGWAKKGRSSKMSLELTDLSSGEVIGTYKPGSGTSSSELGPLEFREMSGEWKKPWEIMVLITGMVMVGKSVENMIGKEVLKAVIGMA